MQKKGKKKNFAVVVSKFNQDITENLLSGCLAELRRMSVNKANVKVVWVPGAWEIPVAALKLAKQRDIHAVICLGSIIRGETSHFDFVAQGCCNGIQKIALETGKPIILGVLTTDTFRQAKQRSQASGDNKGCEAAQVAIEMVQVLEEI